MAIGDRIERAGVNGYAFRHKLSGKPRPRGSDPGINILTFCVGFCKRESARSRDCLEQGPDFKQRTGRREGKVSEESVERGADSCLVVLRSAKAGPFRSRWKLPTLKTRLAIAYGGG
jgi:hypothetical protein